MADLLQDLEDYIVANTSETSASIFHDYTPDNTASLLTIYEYSGSAGLGQMDGVERSIQFAAADLDPVQARTRANVLYNLFSGADDNIHQLTTERWAMIICKQPVFKLKQDQRARYYYGFNAAVVTYSD